VQCRRCNAGLGGGQAAAPRRAQVIDVHIARKVTEWLLPGLSCPCCGTVTFAEPPPGLHAGAVSYGPVLNAAAVLLACYGNVPSERAAQLAGMLLGVPVSAGWVDKAAARTSAQLGKAGFDEAMIAALAAGKVLAADETPVNVLDKTVQPAARDEEETDPEEKDGKAAAGAPHVLIVRTPDGRLTFLQAIASRRKADAAAGIPAAFTGPLITDGYTGYQHLLSRLAGIQQCCQHVIRRARAVTKSGPGGLQSWAGDIITILREAHRAVEDARARGSTALDPQVLQDLRERYDQAVSTGIIHNRLRDWHEGNHPGYALGCWLRDYKEQVFLFTRDFNVSWTNNVNLPSSSHHFLCVSLANGTNGSTLIQESCNYQNPPSKQRFVFHLGPFLDGYTWRVMDSVPYGGHCINIANASTANGAAVQQHQCATVQHHSSWFIFVKPGTRLPCPCTDAISAPAQHGIDGKL
jgi:transposase